MPGDAEKISRTRAMFLEYQDEIGVNLCFQSFDEEMATLPGAYGPPMGCLMLVFSDGELAACGGLRPLEEGICELKRIYVRPAFRRLGIAVRLSMKLMTFGIEQSYSVCRLDTLRRLAGAVEMYAGLGFKVIEAYNYNPEPDIVYMERRL